MDNSDDWNDGIYLDYLEDYRNRPIDEMRVNELERQEETVTSEHG